MYTKENGNLLKFAEYFGNNMNLLENTPDTALIQVLRNLNPSFVLDLTATPRKNSNIISYADARELKKENMVKRNNLRRSAHTDSEVM